MQGTVKITPTAMKFFLERGVIFPSGVISRKLFSERLKEAANHERSLEIVERTGQIWK
jgi:hypothetical protein